MPLSIRVELLRDVYEATTESGFGEWPPHPARLFCAMVAVAADDNDQAALEWLERQTAPTLVAAGEWSVADDRPTYVPTNQLVAKASAYQRFIARKADGPKRWRRIVPAHRVIGFQWAAEPNDSVRNCLGRMVERIGYLGRSTSPVVAEVVPALSLDNDALDAWNPDDGDATPPVGDSALLTTPRPGFLADLAALHRDEEQPWLAVRRAVQYRRAGPPSPTPPARGPYGELIILPFQDRRISAGLTMVVTTALRKALESRLDGGPLELRGRRRGDDGPRHQIACLGLPFVGAEHATGDLLGVALALPHQLDTEVRRDIVTALAHTQRLTLGRLGVVDFEHGVSGKHTLRRETWSRPSHEWVSATPISSDRYHKKIDREVLAVEVRRMCAHVDLPEPTDVFVSNVPLLTGAPTVRPNLRVRRRGDRPTHSYHARVVFPIEVAGPIVLGNLRHYGLGLMRPIRQQT